MLRVTVAICTRDRPEDLARCLDSLDGGARQDAEILVVDKPHFLPTTPGGTYISESALVRLRVQLDIPDLIPMHRLDRLTAGVLLFSTNPATRGRYQVLFEKRRVEKEYEAIAAVDQRLQFPLVVRNRMVKSRTYLLAEVVEGEFNAETRIELEETRGVLGRYRLEPHTGKTHQLRVHMASLGVGILHDPFYPVLLDKAPDDYSRPLQHLINHSQHLRELKDIGIIQGTIEGVSICYCINPVKWAEVQDLFHTLFDQYFNQAAKCC